MIEDEAYCVRGCGQPGVYSDLWGMIDEIPIYELVCDPEGCR